MNRPESVSLASLARQLLSFFFYSGQCKDNVVGFFNYRDASDISWYFYLVTLGGGGWGVGGGGGKGGGRVCGFVESKKTMYIKIFADSATYIQVTSGCVQTWQILSGQK